MVIADVIDHAMHTRLLLSSHQQLELEAILVEVQADLADLVVPEEVHEDLDEKERQDHQRR